MSKEQKNSKELRLMELRALDDEEGKMIVEGYAVRFNEKTLIGDEEWGWYEVIDPTALNETNMKDVPLKYQHGDTKGVLARTRNKSLTLTIDNQGLKIRAELIDTQDNIDIYKSIKAGLLYQMSFAFDVVEEDFDRSTKPVTRTIKKIGTLYDVSVVDFGAYPTTSIYARSKEIVGEQLKHLQGSLDNDTSLDNEERALDNALELEKLKINIREGRF